SQRQHTLHHTTAVHLQPTHTTAQQFSSSQHTPQHSSSAPANTHHSTAVQLQPPHTTPQKRSSSQHTPHTHTRTSEVSVADSLIRALIGGSSHGSVNTL